MPDLRKMRNVGEHVDEYVIGKGRDRSVSRLALQTGSFDNVALDWLGGRLDADEAFVAAEALYRAIKVVS